MNAPRDEAASSAPHPRFNVFGRVVEVRREGAQWQAYRVGSDGKRTPAGFVVPDFVANAGGVICAAMEYAGASRAAAFDAISERVRENTATVLAKAKADGQLPRRAAQVLAEARVREAMALRRFSIM